MAGAGSERLEVYLTCKSRYWGIVTTGVETVVKTGRVGARDLKPKRVVHESQKVARQFHDTQVQKMTRRGYAPGTKPGQHPEGLGTDQAVAAAVAPQPAQSSAKDAAEAAEGSAGAPAPLEPTCKRPRLAGAAVADEEPSSAPAPSNSGPPWAAGSGRPACGTCQKTLKLVPKTPFKRWTCDCASHDGEGELTRTDRIYGCATMKKCDYGICERCWCRLGGATAAAEGAAPAAAPTAPAMRRPPPLGLASLQKAVDAAMA